MCATDYRLPTTDYRLFRRILRHPHDQLAEIPSFEQTHERGRGILETVDDVLAELQTARHHQRRALLEKRRRPVGVVADDEPPDHRAMHEQRAQVGTARV